MNQICIRDLNFTLKVIETIAMFDVVVDAAVVARFDVVVVLMLLQILYFEIVIVVVVKDLVISLLFKMCLKLVFTSYSDVFKKGEIRFGDINFIMAVKHRKIGSAIPTKTTNSNLIPLSMSMFGILTNRSW